MVGLTNQSVVVTSQCRSNRPDDVRGRNPGFQGSFFILLVLLVINIYILI